MKNRIIMGAVILALIAAIFFFVNRGKKETGEILVPVKKGEFVVNVSTTGELIAQVSEPIKGPEGLREARIFEVKISDMIPDGSIVNVGDYVATLDKTEITNRIKDIELELEKLDSQFIRTRLDTTMEMRNAREELINLKFSFEESKITVEQSIYEPPATQRQSKLQFDRTQRTYEQAVKNFRLKQEKSIANIGDVERALKNSQQRYDNLVNLVQKFTIYSPKAGMVFYKRNWDGTRQGIGSNVSTWENIIAEIPDLTKMISKTYVNEIDVSKIVIKQQVEIRVDAFPAKKFTGTVQSIANVGERMRGSNAKVFEVIINLHEANSILRPAMTTQNLITTATVKNVIYIPIECIHKVDGLSFVYSKNRTRKEVKPGQSNDNEVIIKEGLAENEMIYLVAPEKSDEWPLFTLPKKSSN
jgi:HlyD family secretion protein